MRRTTVMFGFALALACLSARDVFAARYRIVTLDVLPGGVDSFPTAINDQGVVVGHSTLDRSGHVGRSRPVMWDSSGTPIELWDDQEFGGIPADINRRGQVVGRYGSGSGIPLPGPGIPEGGAFIWDPVTRNFMDLGDLGGRNAQATGINDAGQVSGSSENFEGQPRAFIWDAVNDMRPIGTLGGAWSFGNDINSSGQIAGYSWLSDFSEHAFFWDPITGMHNIGSPSGGGTRGASLNDLGQLAGIEWGTSTTPGGLIIANKAHTDLIPVRPGTSLMGFDINNQVTVVGYIGAPDALELEAFLWSDQNGFVMLADLIAPELGWNLKEATGINDRGKIIGFGILDDRVRGFLLTPIPEPTSFAIAVSASGSVLGFSLIRRRSVN